MAVTTERRVPADIRLCTLYFSALWHLDLSRKHFAHITRHFLCSTYRWLRALQKFSTEVHVIPARLFLLRALPHIFSLPYPRTFRLLFIPSCKRACARARTLSSLSIVFSRTTSLITTYFNTIRRRVTPTIEGITINAWSRVPAEIIFLKRRMHDQL